MPQNATAIHKVLQERFDLEELRTLCFNLGVDYDNLRGEGKAARSRELILFMQRHGRLDELVTAIHSDRGLLPMDSSGGQAPKPGGQVIINTGGGAYVAGDVTVTDGDFVGRDQHGGEQGNVGR
jgi:hypothetical protein